MKTFAYALALMSIAQASALELPKIFNDHMVLQRDQPIQFWGTAAPKNSVSVTLAQSKGTTQADADGNWQLELPAQPAAGPLVVTIKEGDQQVQFSDVYLGDVWFASGQSNMEWKLSGAVVGADEEFATSKDFSQIRFFEVPNEISATPETEIPKGAWAVASPETTPNFSAVAWYFAKNLTNAKNVAVGIVESNWGGTPAEAWTPLPALLETSGYKKAAQDLQTSGKDWPAEIADNQAKEVRKWELYGDLDRPKSETARLLDYDDSKWTTVSLPNANPVQSFAWFRKTISLEQGNESPARIQITNVNQDVMVFVNGEYIGMKNWQYDITSFEVPAGLLQEGENIIALRAADSWDDKVTIGAEGQFFLELANEQISLEGDWKYSNQVEPIPPKVKRYSWMPSFLYNKMVNPYLPYRIKGVIWYQGESNAGHLEAPLYHQLFTTMINEWRKGWGYDFPFLFVQLANYMQRNDQPSESDWAILREAQLKTLELPHTGMATIIDIGEAKDIHPRNKADVGKRLWKVAESVAYGDGHSTTSGPLPKKYKFKKGKAIIDFSNTGASLQTSDGKAVTGFAVAGEDKVFHWAKGEIKGNKIIVSAPEVPHPVSVRYAWADNPACNLVDSEGYPATPFRSDEW